MRGLVFMKTVRQQKAKCLQGFFLLSLILLGACALPEPSNLSTSSTATTSSPSSVASTVVTPLPPPTPRVYDPPLDISGSVTPSTQLVGKIVTIPLWCPHPCEILSQQYDSGYRDIVPPKLRGETVDVQDGRKGSYVLQQGDGSKLIADNREVYAAVADKYKKLDLKQELEKETRRAKALKAKIPTAKRVATQKFTFKVDRIFSSMEDYYISTIGSRSGGGILRKDIDRYDDAIVEAKGEVPDEIIAYVEEVYRALRNGLGTTNSDNLTISAAKRMAMKTLAE